MKRLSKLSFIIFIPLVLGIIFNVIGATVRNAQLSRVGGYILSIGLPVTVFVLVIVGIVLTITGKLEGGNKSDDMAVSEKEREDSEIYDINSSYSYESSSNYVRHAANNYKNSTTKEKVLGWLLLGFLIIDLIVAFISIYNRRVIGFIVCFCIFVVVILLCLVITKTREKRSMNAKVDITKNEILCGEVKVCVMSSATTVGGAETVIYRIVILSEGKTYNAYSDRFYERGETVVFAVIGKNRASIVDKDKFIKETDEILNNNDDKDNL